MKWSTRIYRHCWRRDYSIRHLENFCGFACSRSSTYSVRWWLIRSHRHAWRSSIRSYSWHSMRLWFTSLVGSRWRICWLARYWRWACIQWPGTSYRNTICSPRASRRTHITVHSIGLPLMWAITMSITIFRRCPAPGCRRWSASPRNSTRRCRSTPAGRACSTILWWIRLWVHMRASSDDSVDWHLKMRSPPNSYANVAMILLAVSWHHVISVFSFRTK